MLVVGLLVFVAQLIPFVELLVVRIVLGLVVVAMPIDMLVVLVVKLHCELVVVSMLSNRLVVPTTWKFFYFGVHEMDFE